MPSEKRCDLTDLIVAQCAHCTGADPEYQFPYLRARQQEWWDAE